MDALTYVDVGASLDSQLPAGYRHFRYGDDVGSGAAVFDAVVESLFNWRLHADAGVRRVSGAAHATVDTDVSLRPWRLPFSLRNRVVAVVDEPHRKGFAYGTLPGHPEQGEALFLVAIDDAGAVRFEVSGFSRPVSFAARMIGSVSRLLQDRANNGYVAAARAVGHAAGKRSLN